MARSVLLPTYIPCSEARALSTRDDFDAIVAMHGSRTAEPRLVGG